MKKKQLNFTEKDFDVLEFLEQQPNQSQYIIRLVRDDMAKPKGLTWADLWERMEQKFAE